MILTVRGHAKQPCLRRTLQLYQQLCVAFPFTHTYRRLLCSIRQLSPYHVSRQLTPLPCYHALLALTTFDPSD